MKYVTLLEAIFVKTKEKGKVYMENRELIKSGKAVLGLELGSTRIKAVLVGDDYIPMASGSHEWENKLVDNIWTYSLCK